MYVEEHHPLCMERIAYATRQANESRLSREMKVLVGKALKRVPQIADLSVNRLKMMAFYWAAFSKGTPEQALSLAASYGAQLLQEGSDKLKKTFGEKGLKFREFSLVAALNCPGAGICKKFCYTEVGRSTDPRIWARRAGNWYASQRDDFVTRINAQIRWEQPKVVRIHVAGDFYDPAYIKKWMRIIESNPSVRFYAYTKSIAHMKKVERDRPKGLPTNFGVVYSWGATKPNWSKVEPLKGDRMSVIVAGPGPGGFGVVRDHARATMVPELMKSNKRYGLRSVKTGASLYNNSTKDDYSAAYGKEQIIVLHWHGGSNEEIEGVGREDNHEHSMPLTLQRWDGKKWTAPDSRVPSTIYTKRAQ
jgi:hypothetical protein